MSPPLIPNHAFIKKSQPFSWDQSVLFFAPWPLILDVGTVLESGSPLICASFVCFHLTGTGGWAVLDNTHGKDSDASRYGLSYSHYYDPYFYRTEVHKKVISHPKLVLWRNTIIQGDPEFWRTINIPPTKKSFLHYTSFRQQPMMIKIGQPSILASGRYVQRYARANSMM